MPIDYEQETTQFKDYRNQLPASSMLRFIYSMWAESEFDSSDVRGLAGCSVVASFDIIDR